MSGLPRDILKWMQSLDLSYSVKNVKRDFSNGFLVAEILSRYYKHELTMHSFDNGIGLVKRIGNWALLEKLFRKLNFPIDRTTIDGVIHCKPGAALPLMAQLYTLLTHKTVATVKQIKENESIPPFARPTASQLIKERLSEADLADSHVLDTKVAPSKAAAVLAAHMQKLKVERETEPQRFQPKQPNKKNTAPPTNTSVPVHFKEVQVRQVDDRNGVMALRANHVYHHQPHMQHQPQAQSQTAVQAQAAAASATSSPNRPTPPPHAASTNSLPALTILSNALLNSVPDDTPLGSRLRGVPGKDAALVFSDLVCFDDLSDGDVAGLLHALSNHPVTTGELVAASLDMPKEFWIVSNWIFGLLSKLSCDSQGFYHALNLYSNLGLRMVARDSHVSTQLFHDFAFTRFLTLLKEQPNKIFQLAKVVYTFVKDDATEHVKILESVRSALGLVGAGPYDETNTRIFYSVLAALAPYENALLVANNMVLLNSYLRFVTHGLLASNTARVRAVALSILAPLSANPNYDGEVLKPILDKVRPLLSYQQSGDDADSSSPSLLPTGRGVDNDEWLIDAELLHVLSCVLNHSWVQSSPSTLQEIHSWIEVLLSPATVSSLPTTLAGLAHIVHVLGTQPPLRKVWLAAIVESEFIRRKVLGETTGIDSDAHAADDSSSFSPSHPLSVSPSAASTGSTSDLVSLFCPPLRSVWHPLTVAQTLADAVRISRLDNLSQGHIELLAAATEDAFGSEAHPTPFVDSEASEWSQLFMQLRDHLVVELCDASLSEHVIGILRRFLFDPRTSTTAQSIFLPNEQGDSGAAPPPLYCIMRFMYPDAADESQVNLAGFLEELATIPAFISLVHKNVQVFAENEADKFQDSPLTPLLQKLDQQAEQAREAATAGQ